MMLSATSAGLVASLVDAAIKGTIILALAAGATSLMRGAAAATRHLVWTAAVAGVLALPLLSPFAPHWSLPILPQRIASAPRALEIPSVSAPSIATPAIDDRIASRPARPPRAIDVGTVVRQLPMPSVPRAVSARTPRAWRAWAARIARVNVVPNTLAGWAIRIWALGALVVLARLVFGTMAVGRLVRRAALPADPTWLALMQRLSRELGIRRPVTLLIGHTGSMPVTTGIVYPVVLLPADAVHWSEERRRAVLLHELAHVERFDALTHIMAQLALAVFWFNPLVAHAERKLRAERERACDDLVLAVGMRATSYADDLLDLVQTLGATPTASAALAMARRSEFEGRLLAILDPAVPRARTSRRTAAIACTIAAVAVVPLAAARPTTRPSARPARQAVDTRPLESLRRAEPVNARVAALGAATTQLAARAQALGSAVAGSCAPRGGTHISRSDDGTTSRTMIADASHCLEVVTIGRVDFTDDESDIASIASGGSFDLSETRKGITRRLRVRERGGSLARTFWIDGDERPATDATSWLREIVPTLVRESTVGVEGRVARVRRAQGAEGVIATIGTIASDGVKRLWFRYLLDGPALQTSELVTAARAASSISSDGDKARVLSDILTRSRGDVAVASAVVETAQTISSDGDRREVLSAVAQSPSATIDLLTRVAHAAFGISSDGDKRALLTLMAPRADESTALRSVLIDGANSISSDGDHAQLLIAMIGKNADDATRVAALRSAMSISSDGDRARVLTTALTSTLLANESGRTAYINAADGISSDGDHAQVLLAAARAGNPSSAALVAIARSAARIASDHDKTEVLLAIARSGAAEQPTVREAIVAALRTVSSGSDYRRVMDVVTR